MKRLGITGRYRDAAVALSVDGQVVAAASEDSFARVPGIGYAVTGGRPAAAIRACLETAGLTEGDLDEVVVVSDPTSGSGADHGTPSPIAVGPAPVRLIEASRADALQVTASTPGGVVVVWSLDTPHVSTFVRLDDGGVRQERADDSRPLAAAARTLAGSLGGHGGDPFAALDRLSVGGEPDYEAEMAAAMGWGPSAGLVVDEAKLVQLVTAVGAHDSGGLAGAAPWNERLQRPRRALAASFLRRVAEIVGHVAEHGRDQAGRDEVAFGGTMFAHARLNTELRQALTGPMALAAVPESAGRALGAALATGSEGGGRLTGLALGPAFTDAEIKRTLDNCRLDSVYEPDRPRIYDRVSKLLAQGKVVAWFQGAMAFGPRSLGTRSVLCDPSGRYARQNVNEYLRQVALDEALPVVFAPSVGRECLETPVAPEAGVFDARVAPAWRAKLGSALDWRQSVRVHARSAVEGGLSSFVEAHFLRTGVPGLIEINLSGPGEPVACTPRDAVRTVYSSAIDALVIGGFILMKDYWLLRAD